jgi:hypothetical protein
MPISIRHGVRVYIFLKTKEVQYVGQTALVAGGIISQAKP